MSAGRRAERADRAQGAGAGPPPEPAGRARARLAWVLFDWAAQPYFTLVTTFLFAPYFAAHFIGDPVRGQALWGQVQGIGGALIALLAPVLGAVADSAGRRKPWIALFSLAAVAGSFALWFATPSDGLPVWAVMLAVAVSLVGVEFATAFTNAMLPELARPGRIGRLSGAGWSVGYLGGIVSLVLVLGWLAPSQAGGRTLFGLTPLLPLGGAHAADRLTGPYSALWYGLFVIPLFVFVHEKARPATGLGAAVRQGLRRTWATLTHIRRLRNIALFLLARMAYFDGLTALFVFGGIYAAGQFGWATMELGVYGVVITFFAAAGALAAGPIDDRLGPKRVCLAALWVLLVCVIAIGSLERDHVLFVLATAPARPDALFSSLPEQAFLALSALIGIFAGPLQASSRSLMARISPPGQMTAFFGLYALSGKATAFLAPLSVALLTSWSGTQRLGLAAVIVFLGAGLALLVAVREERAPSVLED